MEEYTSYYLLWPDDIIWAPLCLMVLSIFIYKKSQRYKDTVIRQYYLPAFYLRILFATIFTLVSQYYFEFADTNHYYQAVLDMHKAVANDYGHLKDIYFNLKLTKENPVFPYFLYDALGITHLYMYDVTNYFTPKFALPFSLLFGKSYLAICYCLSLWAFGGCWRLFKMFYSMYPHLHKKIAIACLFMPSLLFWGTGLLKDTICLGAIGYSLYAAYNLFIRKKYRTSDVIMLLFSGYLLFYIKAYILISLLAAFLLWNFMQVRGLIEDRILRQITTILVVCIAGVAAFLVIQGFAASEITAQFTTENIVKATQDQQQMFNRNKIGTGSNFKVAAVDNSIGSMLAAFPLGIVNTFFRPFPWDVRSPFMALSFMESFAFLTLTMMAFRKLGFKKFFGLIASDPVISFAFVFAIVFGGFVGMTTGNFGALNRYKIPALPFYAMAIILVMDKSGKFSPHFIFSKKFF
ncbi:MAG: hypothetical protein HYZ15_14440 [Sphingobacteriales bacterium]|nr:hypothetical protein [Sphingobacteriales bacterium]